MMTKCTPFSLRYTNLLATLLTALAAARCRALIELRYAEPDRKVPQPTLSFYSYHTAINIALFPVLFFFSGLYYTDVVSTLFVLVAYQNHLARLGSDNPGILSGIWTVILGVATLFMRQTNVFWVVVYMGGAEAFHAVRTLKAKAIENRGLFYALMEPIRFYWRRYSTGNVHDPRLRAAWPDGMFLFALKICVRWLTGQIGSSA